MSQVSTFELSKSDSELSKSNILTQNYFSNIPETKTLFEAFKYLKDNNLLFADMHSGNLMKRSNGDIVISDPGLFQTK